MEFDLTETQRLFQQSARELFAQELPSVLVRETSEKEIPHEHNLWQQLVEQGWTGLIFPEELGGQGLGLVDMAVAFEEMGRAIVPGPFLSTVPLAGALLNKLGKAGNASAHLKAICDGDEVATVALLEESVSWNPSDVQLPAARTPEGVTLKGKKLFVIDAARADIIIVPARAAGEMILTVVKKGAAGLTVNEMAGMDTLRPLYEVVFDGTPVAEADILARGDSAQSALSYAIDVATIALAAEMVGGMQWVLDATVEYAKTRKQFGKPIGSFQAIQHHCANMLLMTESARSAVYYAAWVMESEPEQAPIAVSVAKAYASDSYREVGNLGIQTHGGIGFTWDHELHFYYKRAKSSELMFGDANYHRERIASIAIDGNKAAAGAAG